MVLVFIFFVPSFYHWPSLLYLIYLSVSVLSLSLLPSYCCYAVIFYPCLFAVPPLILCYGSSPYSTPPLAPTSPLSCRTSGSYPNPVSLLHLWLLLSPICLHFTPALGYNVSFFPTLALSASYSIYGTCSSVAISSASLTPSQKPLVPFLHASTCSASNFGFRPLRFQLWLQSHTKKTSSPAPLPSDSNSGFKNPLTLAPMCPFNVVFRTL